MCRNELLVENLVGGLDLETGDFIPLRKWDQKELPKDSHLRNYKRDIKTRGEIKEVEKTKLSSNKGSIARDWKFRWIPREFKKKNGYLWGKVPSNKIGIYRFSNNNRAYSSVLKTRFKLQSEMLQGIGLLEGEMIRSKDFKSSQYISFSNMKPDLVKVVINSLKNIGISRSRIRAQPIVNTKEENKIEDQEILNYWIKNLNLKKDNFVGVHRDSRYKTEAEFGSINIKIYDTIARSIIERLLVKTKRLDKPEFKEDFLKGLFAAEGSVNFSPLNRLNYLSIGVKNEKLRNQYREMFKSLGISLGGNIDPTSNKEAKKKDWQRGSGGYFIIQGTENFQKIFEHDLLELFPKKKIEMLIGLKNRKSLPEEFRKNIEEALEETKFEKPEIYNRIKNKLLDPSERDREVLNLLRKLGDASRQEIAEELDINPSSASRRMRSLYQKNLVKRNKECRKVIWAPNQDS